MIRTLRFSALVGVPASPPVVPPAPELRQPSRRRPNRRSTASSGSGGAVPSRRRTVRSR